MTLNEILTQRYSVRKYSDRPVEPEKLQQILQAASLAPSAVNRQPVRLILVQSPKGLENLEQATSFYRAPLGIIVCADTTVAWTRELDWKNHADIDASIVTDHMMLKATELGLGTVWICRFDPGRIRQDFALPEHWIPVNILAIGYPAQDSQPSAKHTLRRAPEEYIFRETAPRA